MARVDLLTITITGAAAQLIERGEFTTLNPRAAAAVSIAEIEAVGRGQRHHILMMRKDAEALADWLDHIAATHGDLPIGERALGRHTVGVAQAAADTIRDKIHRSGPGAP